MKEVGVYIHIPFCKRKCYYCDFVSFANCENEIEEYISILKEEIKQDKGKYKPQTIYIGGGTPSYIESKYIKEILEEIDCSEAKEITIEINPGTATEEKLQEYFNIGINRLSIGLQSTENDLLKQIGRIHTYEEFINTYNIARKIGFKNINVDLIIGLPNQTVEIVKQTIQKIIEINPEHISMYSLIVEEDTILERKINSGELVLPDEEEERKMYWLGKRMLEEAGYKQYEISNFSKEGYESKHNLDCWNQKEYIGYGLNAHSYIDNVRFCNTHKLQQYTVDDKIITEKQTEYTKMQEYMMLGLRKIEGINEEEFYKKFNKKINEVFVDEIDKLTGLGLIKKEKKFIKLTEKGIDFANLVWQEFI